MAAASAPVDTTTPETSRRGVPLAACGAKTRSGKPCRQQAGWGTDHLGFANCKLHGGLSPNGIKHAATLQARHLAVEVDMEPHEALLWCIRVTAGEVTFFTRRISQLEEEALVVVQASEKSVALRVGAEADEEGSGELLGVEKVERTESTTAHLHIWVEARSHAVDRLAKYSKMALDAGVEERRVRVAEALGGQLGDLIGAILGELQLTAKQRELAPAVVHRHLVALEGGVAA